MSLGIRGSSQFGGGGGVDLAANYNWTGLHTFNAESNFPGNIRMGLNNRLYFSDNNNTYMFADINNRCYMIAGGGTHIQYNSTNYTRYTREVQTGDNGIKIPVRVGDPAGLANYISIYAKDVAASAEAFVQDEALNVTQYSPHKIREWIYRSKNRKTKREIKIAIERFMIENFPQYISINNKPLKKETLPNGGYPVNQKPKWYQFIKKLRLWYNS